MVTVTILSNSHQEINTSVILEIYALIFLRML